MSQLGPYELNSIIEGDCLDLLGFLPDECLPLVFTSPPYNLATTTGGGFDKRRSFERKGGKWNGGNLAFGYTDHDDAMTTKEYKEWQQAILLELWRALASNGAIFYNHKPRVQAGLLWTPLELNPGLPIRQIIIWQRAGGVNFTETHYLPTHEWVIVFAKPGFRLKSKGASGMGDVWSVPQDTDNPHPAPFPVGLPLRAIETVNPGLVLDPFMGSGTTAVAAKMLGCNYLGFDKSPEYCQMARERLNSIQPVNGKMSRQGLQVAMF